jgi:hypothetical protein
MPWLQRHAPLQLSNSVRLIHLYDHAGSLQSLTAVTIKNFEQTIFSGQT